LWRLQGQCKSVFGSGSVPTSLPRRIVHYPSRGKAFYNLGSLFRIQSVVSAQGFLKGLYRYTCLSFEIVSSAAKFQKTMDSILQGLDGVFCYLDDILITGATTEEHLTNLENVLKRLQGCGLQLWKENCHFLKESVEYLSHKVDAEGLHDNESKLQVITHVPPPQNLQELHSFLGLLNCYGCFIPNLSSILHSACTTSSGH